MNAIERCRAIIASRSRSFDLASRLLPPPARDRAVVVYAWCRRADDAIDDAPSGAASGALRALRGELDRIYAGRDHGDPVLDAFAEVARDARIPQSYPQELLAGMEMDVSGHRYRSGADLRLYCYRVAGVVGLMMCHVLGVRDDRALDNAVHLGVAMQLTNICRDVMEDWERGRLYLPDDLLTDCGAGALRHHLGRPFPERERAAVGRAVRILLAHAERHYASGDQGLAALPWRSALAVRTARLVYAAIGGRIAAADHDVAAGRAIVSGPRKLGLVAAATALSAAEAPARVRDRRPARAPGRALPFTEVAST